MKIRESFLAAQKDIGTVDPGMDDVYQIRLYCYDQADRKIAEKNQPGIDFGGSQSPYRKPGCGRGII